MHREVRVLAYPSPRAPQKADHWTVTTTTLLARPTTVVFDEVGVRKTAQLRVPVPLLLGLSVIV